MKVRPGLIGNSGGDRNSSGYRDPTATSALSRFKKRHKKDDGFKIKVKRYRVLTLDNPHAVVVFKIKKKEIPFTAIKQGETRQQRDERVKLFEKENRERIRKDWKPKTKLQEFLLEQRNKMEAYRNEGETKK